MSSINPANVSPRLPLPAASKPDLTPPDRGLTLVYGAIGGASGALMGAAAGILFEDVTKYQTRSGGVVLAAAAILGAVGGAVYGHVHGNTPDIQNRPLLIEVGGKTQEVYVSERQWKSLQKLAKEGHTFEGLPKDQFLMAMPPRVK